MVWQRVAAHMFALAITLVACGQTADTPTVATSKAAVVGTAQHHYCAGTRPVPKAPGTIETLAGARKPASTKKKPMPAAGRPFVPKVLSAQEKASYAAYELEMAAIKASVADPTTVKDKIAKAKTALIK